MARKGPASGEIWHQIGIEKPKLHAVHTGHSNDLAVTTEEVEWVFTQGIWVFQWTGVFAVGYKNASRGVTSRLSNWYACTVEVPVLASPTLTHISSLSQR